MTIAPSDKDACIEKDCKYYISVRGFTDCSYKLTASSGSESVALSDGEPVKGSLTSDQQLEYSFVYTSGNSSSIALNLDVGFASTLSAYITLDNYPPTWAYHQYWLSSSNPHITMGPANSEFLPCLGKRCVVRMALIGQGAYTLTLTTGSTPKTLPYNFPMTGFLQQGQNDLYRTDFTIADSARAQLMNSSLHFMLTGPATAYLSCITEGSNKWPSATSHNWTLTSNSHNLLDVPLKIAFEMGCFRDKKGAANVLVAAVHADATGAYSVQVYHDGSPSSPYTSVSLTAGITYTGMVEDQNIEYFTIRPDDINKNLRYAYS